MRSENPVVIVTGASRGIGRAIAAEFGRAGYHCVIAARDAAALDSLADELAAAGAPRALCVVGDLRDPAQPQRVVEAALKTFGHLDAVINNAGATQRGDFMALTDEAFVDGFALKFHGAVRLCRAAWSALKERHGCIVNIVGIGAHTPVAEFTIGGPVNSALLNFSKALADRGRGEGVRVNTVCPGHIATDRLTGRIKVFAREKGLSYDEAEAAMRAQQGLTRYGKPEEIAKAVRFLCSTEASYITGTNLDVDGGATPGI